MTQPADAPRHLVLQHILSQWAYWSWGEQVSISINIVIIVIKGHSLRKACLQFCIIIILSPPNLSCVSSDVATEHSPRAPHIGQPGSTGRRQECTRIHVSLSSELEQCSIIFSISFLLLLLGALVLSFACSSPFGGMLFGVSGLLLVLLLHVSLKAKLGRKYIYVGKIRFPPCQHITARVTSLLLLLLLLTYNYLVGVVV